jgi:hypothetical protein
MLLLPDAKLDERRQAVRGPLAPLYDSLASELEPLVGKAPYIPKDKALLSKVGGRCEKDGTALEFDPWSPQSHRCPTCGVSYSGELHHRAWITWYQLWLAERAVHAALFHSLKGDARYASTARDILLAYADAYLKYPNIDNVLGPTRPFFSTYLESIWLLQICVATNLLEAAGDTSVAGVVRDRIVVPSRELLAQYGEGRSNRQVWNNAAYLAATLLLRDSSAVDGVINGECGLVPHLTGALLSDGTWFEGDNYHQFAVRGLWYAVTMCEANGLGLPANATRAFDRAIGATFVSALPDFTFPSRKDSQYAVSLRQWRFAELAELGLARSADEQVVSALARCYEDGHERRDTGRSRSTADAERNVPSSLLSRSDLGWRALLHALPELPPLRAIQPSSVHLTGQGFAIFRRPGDVYVGLDYGQSGAGHGHADRLNLTLYQGNSRWLDDVGTGSYVDKSLPWYRSTLAHNAPLVMGRSQRVTDGRLIAYEERGEFGWIQAAIVDEQIELFRTIIVGPGYLIDSLEYDDSVFSREWFRVDDTRPFYVLRMELPYHIDATADGLRFEPKEMKGGTGHEDGFEFTTDWAKAVLPKEEQQQVNLRAADGPNRLLLAIDGSSWPEVWRAVGPGQPASKKTPFYIVRYQRMGLRTVVAWDPGVRASFGDDVVNVSVGKARHVHRRTEAGWSVEVGRWFKRTVSLRGRVAARGPGIDRPRSAWEGSESSLFDNWKSGSKEGSRERLVYFELGERNYRRSEVSWRDAGSPRAAVAVTVFPDCVELAIYVSAQPQRFAPANAVNELDNEHADTMGAGMQLYLRHSGGRSMWMLVPEAGGNVRIREIVGSEARSARIEAEWSEKPDGYALMISVMGPYTESYLLGLAINDAVEGRARRRGQLVTGDARGQFVYVRGDREDESNAIRIDVP